MALFAAFVGSTALGDDRVAVVANANAAYTQRKFGDGQARRETYIIMEGRFYGGSRVDRSLETTPFRQIVTYFVPKLAEQNFLPAKSVAESDLLLVVHWGATNPRATWFELSGQTTPFTPTPLASAGPDATDAEQEKVETMNGLLGAEDRFANLERIDNLASAERSDQDMAQLLGYNEPLRKLGQKTAASTEEQTLRFDLKMERYFVIVRAYELHPRTAGGPRRPVWALHLNISSPGNDFRTAIDRMSSASVNYFGRTTDRVQTVQPKKRVATVELGEPIILGLETPTDAKSHKP